MPPLESGEKCNNDDYIQIYFGLGPHAAIFEGFYRKLLDQLFLDLLWKIYLDTH